MKENTTNVTTVQRSEKMGIKEGNGDGMGKWKDRVVNMRHRQTRSAPARSSESRLVQLSRDRHDAFLMGTGRKFM